MEMSFFKNSFLLFLVLFLSSPLLGARAGFRNSFDKFIQLSESDESGSDINGTLWAILVAGSYEWQNYRHQADVCHAYQILKKGGLKDENIVVFMYDDIAYHKENPMPGLIINHPEGEDVYAGVPKDYTGDNVNVNNLFAVLLGDKDALKGGSGKVVNSKPNDRIFLYYADHGATGFLTMPHEPYLYRDVLIEKLTAKHSTGTYKEMVIYVEACEAGSLFEGATPILENLNIYVTTASNAYESSSSTYCLHPTLPCLGDMYSVSWMEDSETHNRKEETLAGQYERVKNRTLNEDRATSSHVMEYGKKSMTVEKLSQYQGFDPVSGRFTSATKLRLGDKDIDIVVNQRDADLFSLWHRYKNTQNGSANKANYLVELKEKLKHRNHLDGSMNMIGVLLFGPVKGPSILSSSREAGLAVVDDWSCLRSMVGVFEKYCGKLGQYGLKHNRGFANICNNEISKKAMEEACAATCNGHNTD